MRSAPSTQARRLTSCSCTSRATCLVRTTAPGKRDNAADAGSLTVVGTGIQIGSHLTVEARTALVSADEVLFVVGDPVTLRFVEQLNPNARPLHVHYEPGVDRMRAYEAMVEEILAALRRGGRICVAFYGHPGFFAWPTHEAVRRARDEGFDARMCRAERWRRWPATERREYPLMVPRRRSHRWSIPEQ